MDLGVTGARGVGVQSMGRNVETCLSPVGWSVSVRVSGNGTGPESLKHVGVPRVALAPPAPRILDTSKMQPPQKGCNGRVQ